MTHSLTCEDLLHYLSEYLDQQLADELVEAARQHLATCHNCRVVLDATQRTILLYREHGQKQVLTDERQSVLYDRIAAAFAVHPAPYDE